MKLWGWPIQLNIPLHYYYLSFLYINSSVFITHTHKQCFTHLCLVYNFHVRKISSHPQYNFNVRRISPHPQYNFNVYRISSQPQYNFNVRRISPHPQYNFNVYRISSQPQYNFNVRRISSYPQYFLPTKVICSELGNKHVVSERDKSLKQLYYILL